MRLAMTRRAFIGTAASAAAAVTLGGSRTARAAGAFTMQAAWINDAEFMGYFIAIDKGWYAEEGLELTYLSGGPDVIPESSLLSNKADLALTTPDTTAKAVVDHGADFKIIGTQYQKNPIGVVSLASNPINEPGDLVGKTLAVPPVNVISVEAMFRAQRDRAGRGQDRPLRLRIPRRSSRARSTPRSTSPRTCPIPSSRRGRTRSRSCCTTSVSPSTTIPWWSAPRRSGASARNWSPGCAQAGGAGRTTSRIRTAGH